MYLTFINVGLTLGIFINIRLATLNVNVPNSLIKEKKNIISDNLGGKKGKYHI